jgi:hypothetical protein
MISATSVTLEVDSSKSKLNVLYTMFSGLSANVAPLGVRSSYCDENAKKLSSC